MHVNRTGSGIHRDSRREVRMSRSASRRWAIQQDLEDLTEIAEEAAEELEHGHDEDEDDTR